MVRERDVCTSNTSTNYIIIRSMSKGGRGRGGGGELTV